FRYSKGRYGSPSPPPCRRAFAAASASRRPHAPNGERARDQMNRAVALDRQRCPETFAQHCLSVIGKRAAIGRSRALSAEERRQIVVEILEHRGHIEDATFRSVEAAIPEQGEQPVPVAERKPPRLVERLSRRIERNRGAPEVPDQLHL